MRFDVAKPFDGQTDRSDVSNPAQWRPAAEHPLLWALAAAGAGIVADRYLPLFRTQWCAVLVVALLAALVANRRRHSRLSALCLLLCLAALAGLWHHDRWHLYPDASIVRYCRETPIPVVARVRALDAPQRRAAAAAGPLNAITRGDSARVEVHVEAIRRGARWQPVSGRAVVIVEGRLDHAGILRGDQLEIAARLAGVRRPLNPGEPDFAGLCRGRRQSAVLLCRQAASVRLTRPASEWNVLRQLGRLRRAAEWVLDERVGTRRSPLAGALFLGTRQRLDEPTVERLFVSGTLHLLAISGLHVGILVMLFWWPLRLRGYPHRGWLWAAGVCVVMYALMTGSRPPVVRASTLIVLYCLARGTRRPPRAWNSLAAAGLVALALRPSGLFEAGTQLSFLAVATLIAVWPHVAGLGAPRRPLDRLIAASRPVWLRAVVSGGRRVAQLLVVSTVVWLVSLPLVVYRFHLIAPIGIVLNVLLWLPLAAALFLTLLTLVTHPLPPVSSLCGFCCDKALSLIEMLTAGASRLDCGHSWVAGPACWLVVVFYLGLVLWQFARVPLARRWWLVLLSGWLTLAAFVGPPVRPAAGDLRVRPLRVCFVALGHGTCVLVELPCGKSLLYDAGRMGSPRSAALPISSTLWSRGIRHIDALVLSHADADHFNAVPDLLERFSIGRVYVSPAMFRASPPALAALAEAIDRAGVGLGHLSEDMRLVAGDVDLLTLHPPAAATPLVGQRGDNASSIVLQITYGEVRLLLTGDLEGQGLEELLAEQPVDCDVLLAPHHGSQHSRPRDLVRWCTPEVVVISAGAALAIDDAQAAFGSAGARLFWTFRDGQVQVLTDGRRVSVSTYYQDAYYEVVP
jgi:competence protein ComEC